MADAAIGSSIDAAISPANTPAGTDGGEARQAPWPMATAFSTYEAAAAPTGGQGSLGYTDSSSVRRRREICRAPNWLVGAVTTMIRFSTAGASDLVVAANREAVASTLGAPSSKFANADCTTAPSMSDCQRQSESEPFSGGTAEDLQRWQSRLDPLDGLISFRGKYRSLAVIQQLRRKWRDGRFAVLARAPYQDWRRTDSYASFMDAVVAELKDSGDYDRLVDQRLAIGRRTPNYEKDIRTELLLNPGKDRHWVETAMHDFLADWERFKGDTGESGVLGRKLVLWKLLEGERTATQT
ncbi:hypothetical protein [Bordetella flabilis]|nr:hypothetical protein [Bordetella flabilis]